MSGHPVPDPAPLHTGDTAEVHHRMRHLEARVHLLEDFVERLVGLLGAAGGVLDAAKLISRTGGGVGRPTVHKGA